MIGILAATERGELESDLASFHLGPMRVHYLYAESVFRSARPVHGGQR
jgi:hypothetical protein